MTVRWSIINDELYRTCLAPTRCLCTTVHVIGQSQDSKLWSKGSGKGQTWYQENDEDALNEANRSILDLVSSPDRVAPERRVDAAVKTRACVRGNPIQLQFRAADRRLSFCPSSHLDDKTTIESQARREKKSNQKVAMCSTVT